MKKILFTLTLLLFAGCAHLAKNGSGGSDEMKAAQDALSSGDYGRAFNLYIRVEKEKNDPLAQFTLGQFFRNGWGRPENPATACRWFGKAAKGGVPYGQHLYGECLEQGIHQEVDGAAAVYWYGQAAEGGHTLSRCYEGRLYMAGKGVEKNPQRALQLCRDAARRSPVATIWMGRFYLEGDKSIRDYQMALKWFEQSAEYKMPGGYYYLGIMSERGLVENAPPATALQFYEQAAALKYAPAYYPTGNLYFNAPPDPNTGRLSAHDIAKAYLWLSAAVEKSDNQKEIESSGKMLKQILDVIPKTWLPDLDQKLAKHLNEKKE